MTSERDELKQEIGQLKLVRSKCEELQRLFDDERQKNKKLETMLTEYDTMKSNYEVVKKVNKELQESLQVLNGDKVKKKKVDKENIN